MQITPTALPDVLLVEPKVFGDERGFFFESWNRRAFAAAGIDVDFVQDNHSRSGRGVLRGLHYQIEHAQGKLVRVIEGEVFDVAVDLRRSSAAFGRSVGVVLSAANRRMLWIPPGFAHGFVVLSESRRIPLQDDRLLVPAARADAALERSRALHRLAAGRRADARRQGRRGPTACGRGRLRLKPDVASDHSPHRRGRPGGLRAGAQPGRARRGDRAGSRGARSCRRRRASSPRVRQARPQLIVNAAAYTAVDRAESERDAAFAVNARAPGILAEEAKRQDAVLIHYSTDYVFDGRRTTPYDEDAPTGPLNVYGASKLRRRTRDRAIGRARDRVAHQLGLWRARQQFPADHTAPGAGARRTAHRRRPARHAQLVPHACRRDHRRGVARGLPWLAERVRPVSPRVGGCDDVARLRAGDHRRCAATARRGHRHVRLPDARAPSGLWRAVDAQVRGDVRLRDARLARRARRVSFGDGGGPARAPAERCCNSARLHACTAPPTRRVLRGVPCAGRSACRVAS